MKNDGLRPILRPHEAAPREIQGATMPYGQTETYGALAQLIGSPQAARAVGAAMRDNPIAIVLPCHRIVGTHGKLTGYNGGLDRKTFLLQLESEN